MNRARKIIQEVLATAKFPAVLWSAGKDSMLLLSLVREVRKDVSLICFRHGDETFAKQMIMEWDLDVWSWQPSDVYVVPNQEGLSLIREQSFGEHQFPIVIDLKEGEQCVGDLLPERTPELFPHFDVILMGYKDTDYHWSLGGTGFCPDDWFLGKAKVHAPLRHLTDEEVWAAIKELNVPYDPSYGTNHDDSLPACTRCLQGKRVFCPKEQKEIEGIEWNQEESLVAFQKRFGFRRAA